MLAVVVGIVAAVTTFRTMPLGVLTLDGRPGEDVVAVIETPGTGSAELRAGTEYSLMLVGPTAGPTARLDGSITVTTPAGEERQLPPGSAQSLRVTMNDRTARAVATFRPARDGTHTFVVPATDQGGTEVFLADVVPTGKVVAGIFGGVLGILLGVFLGVTGVGLLVGGIVWRVVRKKAPPSAP